MRQGLNEKKHKTMLALLEKGLSVSEVSKFLQVAEKYVEKYAPKPKKVKEEVKEPPKSKPKKKRQRTNTDGNK